MVFRKLKQNTGFSLIEVMVAITILGFVIVPIGSSLVLSFRLNARSEQNLQAQLAVSSAVETIMAEGYDKNADYYEEFNGTVIVSGTIDSSSGAYKIKVIANDPGEKTDEKSDDVLLEDIFVNTYARPYEEGGDGT